MATRVPEPDQRETPASAGLYPIRTVASLTGVHPVTLRAWERRYGLFKPERTPKGHRLYSREQLHLIQRVVGLLAQGVSIGQARSVLGEEPGASSVPKQDPDLWSRLREQMLSAIRGFDTPALDLHYHGALALLPVELVIQQLLIPLLVRLGEQWSSTATGIAEEHFLACYLRNKLGAQFHHLGVRERGPRLLAACLPGELHEIGLLLFGLAALHHGMGLVLLGTDMPPEQLPPVVERAHCHAVVLSGTNRPAQGLLTERLSALVQTIDVPVCIGGPVSSTHAEAIASAGAVALGSDIPSALRRLAGMLPDIATV